MKACVTGGAGFIGSHLVDRLLAAGHEVVVLDNLSTGTRESLGLPRPRLSLVEGDVRDPAAVAAAVAGCEVVFHQAALAAVARSVESPAEVHDVNVLGTFHVLEACRRAGVRRVVFASSSSVYGDTPMLPKREDAPLRPRSPYAATKAAAEGLMLAWQATYGLETVVLRYFNVYGPRQSPLSRYAAVVPRFVAAVRAGQAPVIYGDGQQARDFTWVGDVVHALELAATAPGAVAAGPINIGGGERVSILALAQRVARAARREVAPRHEPERPGDVRDSLADTTRARATLGWQPSTSLDEGLARLMALPAGGLAPSAGREDVGRSIPGTPVEALERRIAARQCTYGVVGLGYVGLPLAVAFAQRGVRVLGFEVDEAKVADVNACRSYVGDVSSEALARCVREGTLSATTDMSRLADVDVISICVPTPLSKSHDPDVSYVEAATRSVERVLRPGQLVLLESTTYPGMTEEFLLPRLEGRGLVLGRDFALAFSPERVDPGNPAWGVVNTPKVVGGVDAGSTRLAQVFYGIALERVHAVSSARAAEMAKLLENTFRSVNIALVNEVALMCDRLQLDVGEVIDAAATKPFGFTRFTPGPGIGGHCIPLDPMYLSWKLRTLDYRARFIELAQDVNMAMPRYVVERVAAALNGQLRSLKGSRVLVLGVAYKPDVDDTRESPSLDVIRLLREAGAEVSYADPYVPSVLVRDAVLRAQPATAERLAAADAVVVCTHHHAFDWGEVAEHARLVVDTRGVVPRERVRGVLVPLSGPPLRGVPAGPPEALRPA